jgi:hypothetical protein
MIYSTVFSNNFVSSVANNLTSYQKDNTGGAAASFAIIYSGAQPTPADFIANWSTDYYVASDTTPNTSAANVLVTYGGIAVVPADNNVGVNIAGADTDILLSVNLNSIYQAAAGTGVYWHNGTAAWAAIFPNQDPPANNGSLLQSSLSSSTNFMLCPVSDNAGNGIVQLSNVTVSGSAPTLDAVDIIITL